MKNSINHETCKECYLCMEVCPCKLLSRSETGEVYFLPEKVSICIKCGQCMAICTTKSIQIESLSYENELYDLPENKVDFTEYINFIANRRSVRNFKDKEVPKEVIEKIISSLDYPPYGAAPQDVHITVVNNRQIIEKALPLMSEFYNNIVKWLENPIMRYIIRKKKGAETFSTLTRHLYPIAKTGHYKLEYGDRITRGCPALLIFHAKNDAEEHTDNSLIYTTYAMLAAHSLGLGSTIVSLVPAAINKIDELKEIFKIPKDHEAITSLILGYSKYKYKRAIKRKKKNVFWLN